LHEKHQECRRSAFFGTFFLFSKQNKWNLIKVDFLHVFRWWFDCYKGLLLVRVVFINKKYLLLNFCFTNHFCARCHTHFIILRCKLYTRGLKLKSTQGPHEHEKMFRRPQIKGKSALRATVYRGRLWRPHTLSNMMLFLHSSSFQS